jgi:hypothetical protein
MTNEKRDAMLEGIRTNETAFEMFKWVLVSQIEQNRLELTSDLIDRAIEFIFNSYCK